MDIKDLSTTQLLNIADGTDTSTDWTVAEALAELQERVVPQNDPETAWRGGIRPTRPNL